MSKTLFLRGVSVVVAMSVYGSAIAYWSKDDLPEVTTGPMNAAESVQVLSVSFAVKSKPKPVMQPESVQESLVKSDPKPEVMPVPYLYLKFVVCDDVDVAEVDRAVAEYRSAGLEAPVYLMPVGGTTDSYFKNGRQVAELALEKGYRYSPRLHVDVFGNAWGT